MYSGILDEIVPTDFHTWGCPVYILDAANQTGGIGTPKWEPRSHSGIYLGHSPCHAGSVALVLNLKTGLVSPQFHLVFDDEFTTVPYLKGSTEPPNWLDLVKHATEKSTDDQEKLSYEWLHPDSDTAVENTSAVDGAGVGTVLGSNHAGTGVGTGLGANTLESRVGAVAGSSLGSNKRTVRFRHRDDVINPVGADEGTSLGTTPINGSVGASEGTSLGTNASQRPKAQGEENMDNNPFVDVSTLGLRRSGRSSKGKAGKRLITTMMSLAFAAFVNPVILATETTSHCYQARVIEYEDYLERNFDGTNNSTSPLAQIYMTSKANNETYTLNEMLKEPDKLEFAKAMEKEVSSLFDEQIWKMVPREEMTRHYASERKLGKSIKREQIMMIWSFKRKRHPDGTLDKHKARLCCHGGQQQWGVNYWDTYAPVVSWSSVRILMTLSKLHNLHTKSVDFVQAYPQAAIKHVIYLKPPAGVSLNNKNGEMVLKLLKNLYGLKDAGLTWFEHLSGGLTKLGFKATSSDPCIFTRGTDMIILYVDDCIIISKTKEEADAIFADLTNKGFKMTDEGTMEEYLGILITHGEDGSFRMSQPHLIDRIIESIPGMKDARSATTPASAGVTLTKDEIGEHCKEHWNY